MGGENNKLRSRNSTDYAFACLRGEEVEREVTLTVGNRLVRTDRQQILDSLCNRRSEGQQQHDENNSKEFHQ